jgi:hypothetical protein
MRTLFLLSIALLVGGCSGKKDNASPNPSPAQSASTAAIGVPKPGAWVRLEDTDQMDGHKTVSYTTRSTNSIHLTSREGPVNMGFICEKNVITYVDSGPVSSKGIRYKFDDEAPYAIGWYVLNNAVGESTSKSFLDQMMKAKTFKFEFTPVGQAPQVASFDLGNLRELIQNEKVCDFQKKATGY